MRTGDAHLVRLDSNDRACRLRVFPITFPISIVSKNQKTAQTTSAETIAYKNTA